MKIYLLVLCLFDAIISTAQVSVLTQHNDLARTGLNQHETILNTTNVNESNFGEIFTRTVDDQIYTQPLVVTNVIIPSVGKKDVVYVGTVNNTLYAFDADDSLANLPYWVDSLTPKGTVVVNKYDMTGACNGHYNDFSDHIGIVSTPVIDTNTHTIFVLTRDLKLSDSSYEQWIHAIDLRDGSEKSYSPVLISAKYVGNGDGSINDTLYFDGQRENQRAALTLINGVVYITWASHCDWAPYHGWVIGYDTTLRQKCVWMDTPNGYDGGVWMSGEGISSDSSGSLYLSVGNGSLDSTGRVQDTANLGESFLKLVPSGDSLIVKSFFTPYDWAYLDSEDYDLGSAGMLLIPNTDWAFSGGKQGYLYLVDRDSMGGVGKSNHNMETFTPTENIDGVYGSPAYWRSDTSEYIYVWPAKTVLFAYKVDRVKNEIDSIATMNNGLNAPKITQGGGTISVSSDSTLLGTGIVWCNMPLNSDKSSSATYAGILRAYDANNLKNLLWTSQQDSVRDSVGRWATFAYPTIANGKVYEPTFSNRLVVYGLLNVSTGLKNPAQTNPLLLYPDPANDKVYFETKSTITTIEIDNMLGQTLKVYSNIAGQLFDVSALAPATYLIRFYSGSSFIVKKLVIVR